MDGVIVSHYHPLLDQEPRPQLYGHFYSKLDKIDIKVALTIFQLPIQTDRNIGSVCESTNSVLLYVSTACLSFGGPCWPNDIMQVCGTFAFAFA